MLVFNLPALKSKKYAAYDHFHRNGLYGRISTKEEPIRMLGFALPYDKAKYFWPSDDHTNVVPLYMHINACFSVYHRIMLLAGSLESTKCCPLTRVSTSCSTLEPHNLIE